MGVAKEKTDKTVVRHRWFMVIAIAVVVAGAAGYIAYDTWLVQQKTQAILKAPGIIVAGDSKDPEKAEEGSEAVEVTTTDFSSYKVAAEAPRLLTIDKLGLAARIKPMGLNSDKSIQAPKNIYDAGWYSGSAQPGGNGAMFIDGHASGSTRMGLFAYLDTLKVGDTVGVEKGDGQKLTYRVVHVATIPLADINMNEILRPYNGVTNGLNLMTCTGTWIDETSTLDHRVVVYTEQV